MLQNVPPDKSTNIYCQQFDDNYGCNYLWVWSPSRELIRNITKAIRAAFQGEQPVVLHSNVDFFEPNPEIAGVKLLDAVAFSGWMEQGNARHMMPLDVNRLKHPWPTPREGS